MHHRARISTTASTALYTIMSAAFDQRAHRPPDRPACYHDRYYFVSDVRRKGYADYWGKSRAIDYMHIDIDANITDDGSVMPASPAYT